MKVFRLFVVVYLLMQFLPRIVTEGMFPDGLTYTAMARNMAIGVGSFWQPYFSSSFWLPFEGESYQFYGHPPLGIWLMSLFFEVFGEHWAVDKVYCVSVWLMNIALIVIFWKIYNQNDDKTPPSVKTTISDLEWLPLFFWYISPVVLWSFPVAMLDNLLSAWSLLTVIFLWLFLSENEFGKFSKFPKIGFYFLGCLTLVAAFMTKGPVALFPAAVPFFYAVCFQKNIWKGLLQSAGLVVLLVLFFLILIQYPPSKHYFTEYFRQQIVGSLTNPNEGTGNRWEFFPVLLTELLPILVVVSLFLGILKWKNTPLSKILKPETRNLKPIFLWLIFLSASLPIMISRKISGSYLVPAMPFAGLAMAQWLSPMVVSLMGKIDVQSVIYKRWMGFWTAFGVGVLVFTATEWGRTGREKELLADIKILKSHIPPTSKIVVCDTMMTHFNYHAYFQRYYRWELSHDTANVSYLLTVPDCKPNFADTLKTATYTPLSIGTTTLKLYIKR
jgi:hypothetical protein